MNYLQKKKLAFMSIVNKVKGFIRTITGAFPLTLEGCVDEESIIDYTLYGNSVQNGTPTPETPVEVESVGEYDETTGKYKIPIKVSGKNLFDIDSVNNSKYVSVTDGVLCNKYGMYAEATGIGCNVKTLSAGTYTLSCEVSDSYNDAIYIGFRINGSRKTKIINYKNTPNWMKCSYTFTLQEESTINGILLQGAGDASNYTKLDVLFRNIQLEEGTTATDYEPYHEPITTNIYLDEPLRKVGDYADYIKSVDLKTGTGVVVRQITKVPKWLQTTNIVVNRNNNVCAFLGAQGARTIAKTLVYCPLFKKVEPEYGWNSSVENIMSHITTVDNYAYYHIKYERLGLAKENGTVYKINDETKTSLTDSEICALAREYFKSNFTEEECSIYVCDYQAPIEEDIDLPNIPTFKGTSIVSADTTTQPSNAEVTYYSNVKE